MDLDGRPVAIWGPNGAGKTNILEAISLLSPGRGLRGATPDEFARRPEGLGWKVGGVLKSLGRSHEVETWAEPGTARQVRIDGKAATQVMLGQVARILWLVPAMDRLWIEGPEGRRRFLDRMTMSFEPRHAEQVLGYEKAMRERNRLLREEVSDPSWYRAIETQMAATGAEIMAARARSIAQLLESQGEAQTAFPRAELTLIDSEGYVVGSAEMLREHWNEDRRRDMIAGRTLRGPHRVDLAAIYSEKATPVERCSTGEQKALLISIVLANARALSASAGAPPILLFDEVAAHLDARRRSSLYDEIVALRAQAFMTGTGLELFGELGGRSQGFEVQEVNGCSEISEKGMT